MSDPSQNDQPLITHLVELRDRMMRVLAVVLLFFLVFIVFANDLYSYLADPLQSLLPEGSSMIATQVASPFLAPFKLALYLSVYCGAPMILYQLWGFIAPGLYQNEKRLAAPLLISSIILFYAGMAFAYFAVFPLVFGFFTSVGPSGVTVMTDIDAYLSFVLKLFLAFGLAFEIPVATILLVKAGVASPESLKRKRPYVFISCFVVGMLITPPDVISQTLLAVPMWLLFEVGLIGSKLFSSGAKNDHDETNRQPGLDTNGSHVENEASNKSVDQDADDFDLCSDFNEDKDGQVNVEALNKTETIRDAKSSTNDLGPQKP